MDQQTGDEEVRSVGRRSAGVRLALAGALAVGAAWAGWQVMRPAPLGAQEDEAAAEARPHVVAGSPVDAGRYVVHIAGCNDCHTSGYLQTGGNVEEELWLLGDPLGWRGPWGTTYPSNLRLFVQDFDEEMWVAVLRERQDRPPMPWMNLHAMSDADLKAIYHYLRHMGPAGEQMPEFVPPTREPVTPYLNLMPVMPEGMTPPPAAEQ